MQCETHKPNKEISRLENKGSTLGLLVTTKLEVLAALQSELLLGLASSALETKDNLLGGLSLLVEDRLGLTTVTTLLSVVTTLTLGEQGGLASLVLGDLVLGVLVALLGLAVSPAGLGDVDLEAENEFRIKRKWKGSRLKCLKSGFEMGVGGENVPCACVCVLLSRSGM